MKRTRKKASMGRDIANGGWVYGWGRKVNQLNHRMDRAVRKRLTRREAEEEAADPLCNFFWGSHGCDLPRGDHAVHLCRVGLYDEDENYELTDCCEYDEGTGEVRHNLGDGAETEWGTWGEYGPGWRQ